MDLGVAGQAYLVIGGSAGIGRAAAEALATDGARVAIAARGRERLETVAGELAAASDAEVVGLCGDLAEPDAADRLVAQAAERFGGLRGMAVTTGLAPRGHRGLLGATDEDWTATFDDVLLAVVRACRATVPVLVEGGGGSIVTTAAYSIRAPKPHQFPYSALKSAVVNVTKNLATSFGAEGVRANCVCPGATETDVMAAMRVHYAEERGWPLEEALERAMSSEWGMQIALGRAGRPEEVGDVIAFLLSERAGYLTGATVNVDGGTDF